MFQRISFSIDLVVIGISGYAWAGGNCPAAVGDAATRSQPGARIVSCKQEKEHGKIQFEVKLEKDGKKLELDVSPEGNVLLTEEVVDVGSVPAPVMSAFADKYPSAKASRAEKQVESDGSASYEVAFTERGKKREATFASDGKFIEQE